MSVSGEGWVSAQRTSSDLSSEGKGKGEDEAPVGREAGGRQVRKGTGSEKQTENAEKTTRQSRRMSGTGTPQNSNHPRVTPSPTLGRRRTRRVSQEILRPTTGPAEGKEPPQVAKAREELQKAEDAQKGLVDKIADRNVSGSNKVKFLEQLQKAERDVEAKMAALEQAKASKGHTRTNSLEMQRRSGALGAHRSLSRRLPGLAEGEKAPNQQIADLKKKYETAKQKYDQVLEDNKQLEKVVQARQTGLEEKETVVLGRKIPLPGHKKAKEGLESFKASLESNKADLAKRKATLDIAKQNLAKANAAVNQTKLEEGEAVIVKSTILGDGREPTKAMHKEAWNKYDEVTADIVSQFPNISIDTDGQCNLGEPPLVDNFNNYGLQPDDGTEVEKDENGDVVSFVFEEETIRPPEGQVAEKEGLIFFKGNSAAMQYHDMAIATKEATGPQTFTLCDGTGQSHSSKRAAELASKTAHEITQGHIGECKTLQQALRLQFSAMKDAQKKLLKDENSQQGTTFVQATVTGNVLSGVAVGDSKVFIFSPKDNIEGWACRDAVGESRATLDPKDSGGRLSGINEDEIELAGMRAFAVQLQPGDIVYICSDGGSDCFDPSNLGDERNTPQALGGKGEKWIENDPDHIEYAQKGMIRNFEETVKSCKTPEEMQKAIKKESQVRSSADKLWYITTSRDDMKGKKPPKIPGQGKADDAATIFFQYNPAE